MRRGDVMLVVAAGALGKPRPAIVVQSDELGQATTTIIICPMSSQPNQPLWLRPLVEPTAENGLRTACHIMADKISALQRSRVRRILGQLESRSLDELNAVLANILALGR